MTTPEDNPFASPLVPAEFQEEGRSLEWQFSAARALRMVPWAIGYHVVLLLLNGLTGPAPTPLVAIVVAGISFAMWVSALVYQGWFASLLYGRLWGVLLAPLAAFPIAGLLALWMFDARARRELRACGWQVRWFTAQLKAETG